VKIGFKNDYKSVITFVILVVVIFIIVIIIDHRSECSISRPDMMLQKRRRCYNELGASSSLPQSLIRLTSPMFSLILILPLMPSKPKVSPFSFLVPFFKAKLKKETEEACELVGY